MRKKSKKPNTTGHGGQRPGAGRKKTNHIGVHLRLKPETLSQIDAIRRFHPQTNRSKIVMVAVALKYEQAMAEKAAGKYLTGRLS